MGSLNRRTILQVHSLRQKDLSFFYAQQTSLCESGKFDDQINSILRDKLSASEIITPYMKDIGYDAYLVIPNNTRGQIQWLSQFGGDDSQSSTSPSDIVRRQIDYYQPDVLYISDPKYINVEFIKSLNFIPHLIVGRAEDERASQPTECKLKVFVSGREDRCEILRDDFLGYPKSLMSGFPTKILDQIETTARTNEVILQQGLSTVNSTLDHSFLNEIADWFDTNFRFFSARFYLERAEEALSNSACQRICPELYGTEAYQSMARAGIVLHLGQHIVGKPSLKSTCSTSDCTNLEGLSRLVIDGTGCGALVFTEHAEPMAELFVPNKEFITYHSKEDLKNKLTFYLANPDRGREIAINGQRRCLSDYALTESARWLDQLIRRYLVDKPVRSTTFQDTCALNPVARFFVALQSGNISAAQNNFKFLQSLEFPPDKTDWQSVHGTDIEPIGSQDRTTSEIRSEEASKNGEGLNLCLEENPKLVENKRLVMKDDNKTNTINELVDAALASLKIGRADDALLKIVQAKAFQQPMQDIDHVRALCFLSSGNKRAALMSLQEELMHFPDNQGAKHLYDELSIELKDAESLQVSAPEFQELLQEVKPYTMLPTARLYSLYLLARKVCELDIPGNFVECGVAGGGSSALLGAVIKRYSKRPRLLYACDSYEGMPAPGEFDRALGIAARDTGWGMGTCAAPEDKVREVCAKLGVSESLVIVKGYFQDTLAEIKDEIGSIGFMHIDCDFYESTKFVLATLFELISNNAPIQVDDYGYWEGMEKAVKEFEEMRNYSFQIQSIDGHSAWFQKHIA